MYWCDGLTYEISNAWNVPASDFWVAASLVIKQSSHVSNLRDIPTCNRPKKEITLSMCKKKIHQWLWLVSEYWKKNKWNHTTNPSTSTDDDWMMMRFFCYSFCELSACSLGRLKWTKIKSDNPYPASAVKMDGSIWVPQNCARIMFFHLSQSTWGYQKLSSCLYAWDSTTAKDNTAWWSMTNNQHDGREQTLTRMEIHFH